MNKFSYLGSWWLPSDPTRQIEGTLTFDPVDGAFLELIGSFQDNVFHFDRTLQVEFMHGLTVNGKETTLFHCMHTQMTSSAGGIPTSKYRIELVLIGHHFQDRAEIAFNEYKVRYSFLEEWLGQRVFAFDSQGVRSHDRRSFNITYTTPEDISATIDDLSITITSSMSTATPVGGTVSASHSNAIKIASSSPISFADFLGTHNYLMQNFLALALGIATRPLEIVAHRADVTKQIGSDLIRPKDVQIFFPMSANPNEGSQIHPHLMIFAFADISQHFETTLKLWFTKQTVLRPVYDLYFAILNTANNYAENEFLSYVFALESYHRRTQPDKYLDDEDALEEVRQALTRAVPDSIPEDFRSSLKQKFKYINEYSFRRRLKDIFALFGNVVSSFLPNTQGFIDDIATTRNYMVHFDAALEADSLKHENLFWATRKLRALIQICLLHELGFSMERIKNIVESKQAFKYLQGH